MGSRPRTPQTSRVAFPLRAGTPASLGFVMPAEWAPHEATLLAWPTDPITFRDLPAVERIFAMMIAALSEGERVDVHVPDDATAARAADLVREAGTEHSGTSQHVVFRVMPTADVWIRDYGPTYLLSPPAGRRRKARRAYVRWRFNAWGGKYEKLLSDDGFPDRLRLPDDRFAPGIVLEGGSIDVDGAGTVLTTERCLLNPNRNPHLNRAEIEAFLRAYLGVQNVLWLGDGIEGDDTDGHVDDVTRFVGPRTIVTAYEDDRSDRNHEPLAENERRLKAMVDAEGRPFEVIRLPMPGPLFVGRRRLPASYANFVIGNDVVLLPLYGPRVRDERARKVLARVFPGRRIVGIDARELVYGCGSFHCVTQQVPAV